MRKMKFVAMPRYQMRKNALQRLFNDVENGLQEKGEAKLNWYLKLDMEQEKYLICIGNLGFK